MSEEPIRPSIKDGSEGLTASRWGRFIPEYEEKLHPRDPLTGEWIDVPARLDLPGMDSGKDLPKLDRPKFDLEERDLGGPLDFEPPELAEPRAGRFDQSMKQAAEWERMAAEFRDSLNRSAAEWGLDADSADMRTNRPPRGRGFNEEEWRPSRVDRERDRIRRQQDKRPLSPAERRMADEAGIPSDALRTGFMDDEGNWQVGRRPPRRQEPRFREELVRDQREWDRGEQEEPRQGKRPLSPAERRMADEGGFASDLLRTGYMDEDGNWVIPGAEPEPRGQFIEPPEERGQREAAEAYDALQAERRRNFDQMVEEGDKEWDEGELLKEQGRVRDIGRDAAKRLQELDAKGDLTGKERFEREQAEYRVQWAQQRGKDLQEKYDVIDRKKREDWEIDRAAEQEKKEAEAAARQEAGIADPMQAAREGRAKKKADREERERRRKELDAMSPEDRAAAVKADQEKWQREAAEATARYREEAAQRENEKKARREAAAEERRAQREKEKAEHKERQRIEKEKQRNETRQQTYERRMREMEEEQKAEREAAMQALREEADRRQAQEEAEAKEREYWRERGRERLKRERAAQEAAYAEQAKAEAEEAERMKDPVYAAQVRRNEQRRERANQQATERRAAQAAYVRDRDRRERSRRRREAEARDPRRAYDDY